MSEITPTKSSPADEYRLISVHLPPKYWVVVLGVMNNFLDGELRKLIKDTKEKYKTEDQVPAEIRTIIAGAHAAHSTIVTALHNTGEMTAEANAGAGLPAFKRLIDEGKKVRERRGSKS